MVKNDGSEDFGGVLASWMVELEAAKEMLAYIYDIQVSEVENWIQHIISEFHRVGTNLICISQKVVSFAKKIHQHL